MNLLPNIVSPLPVIPPLLTCFTFLCSPYDNTSYLYLFVVIPYNNINSMKLEILSFRVLLYSQHQERTGTEQIFNKYVFNKGINVLNKYELRSTKTQDIK